MSEYYERLMAACNIREPRERKRTLAALRDEAGDKLHICEEVIIEQELKLCEEAA